ncbi:two-component regulator propeller domain-containing protein [Bacteroidota bacterium]
MKLSITNITLFIIFIFSDNHGLFAEETWLQYTYVGYVSSIAEEADYIWIGTEGGGLVQMNKITNEKTFYNTSNSSLPDNDVWSIAIESNGEKWMGTDGGLAKFDGKNWTIYDPSNSGLPGSDVRSIAIDDNGNKWIGTSMDGLAKFDGEIWTVYNTSNSELPSKRVF